MKQDDPPVDASREPQGLQPEVTSQSRDVNKDGGGVNDI